MKSFTKKELVFLSFMLFSMFFGAGNLIFPPALGRAAGDHVWLALTGFVLSAVGLPILGVVAIAKSGGFHELTRRVHPWFAVLFPVAIYLTIGPFLGAPRAGSLAFEMGAKPFLPSAWANQSLSLLLYSLVFFGFVLWFALTPSKLVERFGKWLTPLLLLLIFAILIKSWWTPLGTTAAAAGKYTAHPVFQGFLDGYLTGDALAALAFGIVIANTLRAKGVENSKKLSRYMILAGLGAGVLLAALYLILGNLGASSASFGAADNGAQILTQVMDRLFAGGGVVLLGAVFTLACLSVSIGLIASCSQYFASVFPRISYRTWVYLLCAISLLLANMGLTEILQVSVALLGALYPAAIVLILLALADRWVKGNPAIYRAAVGITLLISLVDLCNKTLLNHLPLHAEGVAWLLPALLAALCGRIWSVARHTAV